MERINFFGRTASENLLKNELFLDVEGNIVWIPSSSSTVFADMDDDGDLDAFIGGKDGINSENTVYKTRYFQNTGTEFTEKTDSENPLNDLNNSALQDFWQNLFLADIDDDDDLDAFIGYKNDPEGEYNSGVVYFKNTGDKTNPQFTEVTGTDNPFDALLSGTDVPIYTTLADIDDDGDLDAFIGVKSDNVQSGNTLYYENIGDSANPQFTQVTGTDNPFENVLSLALQFEDLDDDGDLDAFVGSKTEEGQPINLLYENIGNEFVEQTGSDYPLENLRYAPYPTLTDIDGDGDLDAFSQNWINVYSGADSTDIQIIKYYENKPGIYVTPTELKVVEGADNQAVFEVTVIGALAPVTVEYRTEDDTALNSEDYGNTSGQLTFASNGTQQITVPITDNNTNEADKTFKLILENPTNAEISNPETIITVTDTQETATTTTLSAQVETLLLTGTDNINGTGNNNANTLTGNSGNNSLSGLGGNDTLTGNEGNDTLNGGSGNDSMVGGKGDDIYYVQSASDTVTEDTKSGTDKVVSAIINSNLENNVENLTLNGNKPVNGTGNNLNNVIVGNAQNNTLTGLSGNDNLNGGVGTDTLVGGKGNDTYTVDNSGDVVQEVVNEGTDLVN